MIQIAQKTWFEYHICINILNSDDKMKWIRFQLMSTTHNAVNEFDSRAQGPQLTVVINIFSSFLLPDKYESILQGVQNDDNSLKTDCTNVTSKYLSTFNSQE